MTKVLFAAACLGLTANAPAEILFLDSLSIELPPGWVYRVEKLSPPTSDFGDQITVRQVNGVGVLSLQTYTAATRVDAEALRTLTNVPATEPLVRQELGDYWGYRYDYTENGLFYRTWWLAQDTNVLFITYQCSASQESLEIDQLEQILQSLSSATLQKGN
jgi:hypothetical protein